jgi:membrane-bound lytic murein transglycosylase B
MRHAFLLIIVLAAAMAPGAATAKRPAHPPAAKTEQHPGADAFARELAAEAGKTHPALNERAIRRALAGAHFQQSIIDAMTRPAEAKPWKDYRPLFLTGARIAAGVAFYQSERATFDTLAARYGVPAEVIVAIVGVETYYGRNVGKFHELDALATLAFHYPPRQEFFRAELKQLFLLQGPSFPYKLNDLTGSYAGAMGIGQFMPSSIAKYAVDGDGDGKLDLWHSHPDALASIANYLVGYGWVRDAPIADPAILAPDASASDGTSLEPKSTVGEFAAAGAKPELERPADLPANLLGLDGAGGREHWLTYRNFWVISRYNRSPLYCMAVHQLAQAIAATTAANPIPHAAP